MSTGDIRLQYSFRTHPKRVKLQRRLGTEGVLAFIDLLLAVGEHRCSGNLNGWGPEDIGIASGYSGDIQVFIDTLIEFRLLDKAEDGSLSIHEWEYHNPWAAGSDARKAAAKRAAKARWDRRLNSIELNEDTEECESHESAMQDAQKGNAPSPTPSPIPSPTPKDTLVNGLAVDDPPRGEPDPCPHQKIINLYHEILPELPRVKNWTKKRRSSLSARWREDPKHQTLEYWKRFFEHVRNCPFLMGNGDGPRFDLEWLVKEGNFVKVIEGKYLPRTLSQ